MADAVRETPRRLPYMHALGALARSDGVLLIGSDEPHYTASKIYPALMSGRPFLSLFHRASSAHAILTAAGGGRAFAFATPEELAELEAPLAEGLRTLAAAPSLLAASIHPLTHPTKPARSHAVSPASSTASRSNGGHLMIEHEFCATVFLSCAWNPGYPRISLMSNVDGSVRNMPWVGATV